MIRLNSSGVADLHRCPWRWHLRTVRKLARPDGQGKPGTLWGTLYHAAIASALSARALSQRPELAASLAAGAWVLPPPPAEAALAELAARGIDEDDGILLRRGERRAGDLAAEAAAAAASTEEWLAARGWRPAAWDGPAGPVPAIELRLAADLGGGLALDGRIDALLLDPDGRPAHVDHKSVDRWPERTGEALLAEEVGGGIDLRDDLQARIYRTMLGALGREPARTLHLIRRAAVPGPPPIAYADKPTHKLHGPSRSKEVESTPELYRAAVIAAGKDPADYADEIARQAGVRWQGWATVEIDPEAKRRTLPILREAAARAADYASRPADEVPRHHVAGRHPHSCARCPDRELCVLEERGRGVDAAEEIAGRYAPAPDRYPDATHTEIGDDQQ